MGQKLRKQTRGVRGTKRCGGTKPLKEAGGEPEEENEYSIDSDWCEDVPASF